jgi:hypothetical protein
LSAEQGGLSGFVLECGCEEPSGSGFDSRCRLDFDFVLFSDIAIQIEMIIIILCLFVAEDLVVIIIVEKEEKAGE